MHRSSLSWALLLFAGVAGASACLPERLPPGSPAELMCAAMLNCWYPGESGSQFDPTDPAWAGMANPDNARNVRQAYGTNGSCWQVDPMAGTTSEDEPVEATALAQTCGSSCACTVLELCASEEQGKPAPPECAADAADPCADGNLDAACELCEDADQFSWCQEA